MKYLVLLLVLALSGCTQHTQGRLSWNTTTVVDNPIVEVIKAFKGTGSRPVTPDFKTTSQTPENMGSWR